MVSPRASLLALVLVVTVACGAAAPTPVARGFCADQTNKREAPMEPTYSPSFVKEGITYATKP